MYGFFSFIAYLRLAFVAYGVPFFDLTKAPTLASQVSRFGLCFHRSAVYFFCSFSCQWLQASLSGPTLRTLPSLFSACLAFSLAFRPMVPRWLLRSHAPYAVLASVFSVLPFNFVSAFIPSIYLSLHSCTQLSRPSPFRSLTTVGKLCAHSGPRASPFSSIMGFHCVLTFFNLPCRFR